jgi:hypothetical protein
VIDRTVWPTTGALALYRTKDGFTTWAARPLIHRRPWSERAGATPAAAATSVPNANTSRPPVPDATPREQDLEAED